MLARKFSSDGSSRWPAPWRARNATRFPRSVPMTYGPDGSPNGVVSETSVRSTTSAMSYRPLPPMMPMRTFSIEKALEVYCTFARDRRFRPAGGQRLCRRLRSHAGEELLARGLRGRPRLVVFHLALALPAG